MKQRVSLYELQPTSQLIRTTYVDFDFDKKIFPSWYSVIKGTRMCCHHHLHQTMEIIVMKEGRVDFQVSGSKYDLRENDVLIINPFEPHSAIIPRGCDRVVYYALNFDIGRLLDVPVRRLRTICDTLINGNAYYDNLLADGEIKDGVLDSALEIANSTGEDELVDFSALLRIFSKLGEPELNPNEKKNKRSDQFIREVVFYIQTTPLQDVSLEAIANLLSYNKAYFTTLFKKNFGMNFTDYVNNYKITIAKGYIRNGNYNLNEVAEQSGFNYYAYFFKKFKAIVGVSPSEFVEQCRTNVVGDKK